MTPSDLTADSRPELPKNDFYYPRDFVGPIAPTQGAVQPEDMTGVVLDGGLGVLGELQERNLADVLALFVDLEESGQLARFGAGGGAGRDGGAPSGTTHIVDDTRLYTFLEAAAWEIGRTRDAELNDRFEALTDRLLAVQWDDGYVPTQFGGAGQPARYSDLDGGGELASFARLIRAGVARGRTVGRDRFVELVVRVADHVCDTFGPEGIPAGREYGMLVSALAELSRFTGNPRYILQASLLVDEQREALPGEDDMGEPVAPPVGYAPSAEFLAGVLDVAIETSDDDLAWAALEHVRAVPKDLGGLLAVELRHRVALAAGSAVADQVFGSAGLVDVAAADAAGTAGQAKTFEERIERTLEVATLSAYVSTCTTE
jgi:hypothetical protein